MEILKDNKKSKNNKIKKDKEEIVKVKNNKIKKDKEKVIKVKNSENKKEKTIKEKIKIKKEKKEPIKKNERKSKGIFKKIGTIIKKRWLRNTTMTIVLIAIVIAAYIGINFVFEKLNLTDIDFTKSKIYTLTDASKTKVKDIEKEVNIILINLSQYDYLIDYANKYTQVNENIKVEQIDDLASRADLQTKYNLDATSQLIIIKTEDDETTLTINDLFTYDSNYQQIDLTEEAITNAIVSVTIEDKPKIYFLTGHNRYDSNYFGLLLSELEKEANEVKTWDILVSGSIPEDCDCLLITTLKDDIAEIEKDAILDYINKGGNIILLNDPNTTNTDFANFNKILEAYGISMPSGIVIEQEDSKMLYELPEFILPTMNHNEITGHINMQIDFCLIDSGIIRFAEASKLEELGVKHEDIAYTSDKAFLRTDYSIAEITKTEADEDAKNEIVASIVKKKIDEEKTSKLVIYANSVFATNMQVPLNQMYYTYPISLRNNQDMVLNSISYLTERTDTIIIRKDNEAVSYTVTAEQNKIILSVIFIVPAIIVITGIVVWQIRRRKK